MILEKRSASWTAAASESKRSHLTFTGVLQCDRSAATPTTLAISYSASSVTILFICAAAWRVAQGVVRHDSSAHAVIETRGLLCSMLGLGAHLEQHRQWLTDASRGTQQRHLARLNTNTPGATASGG